MCKIGDSSRSDDWVTKRLALARSRLPDVSDDLAKRVETLVRTRLCHKELRASELSSIADELLQLLENDVDAD